MLNDARRYTDSSRTRRNVVNDNSIGTNSRMVAHRYWPNDFCTRTDIDMAANRRTALPVCTNCHLLKEQAIGTNPAVGMNDNAVGMRD